ncbi:hypothetical protein BC828DRAFT_394930 [Blastocladiella britannica]|nr:hypothetical protein BC828DRAFT_394930 [Blastocladiella britannica]
MTKSIFLTLIASALFAASVNAATKPVPGDGSTQTFSTGANGQWTTDTYSVTLAGPGILRVWDGYCFGDRYEVTIDGAVVGTTSEGSPAGGHCNALSAAPTPEFAWGNKAFSRGVYSLTAGDHTFQFTTTTHPWGGPAYFAVGSGSVCITISFFYSC